MIVMLNAHETPGTAHFCILGSIFFLISCFLTLLIFTNVYEELQQVEVLTEIA